jgi:hypothetical protein
MVTHVCGPLCYSDSRKSEDSFRRGVEHFTPNFLKNPQIKFRKRVVLMVYKSLEKCGIARTILSFKGHHRGHHRRATFLIRELV